MWRRNGGPRFRGDDRAVGGTEYNILVHALRERAASGNALAVSAVARLKL